MATKRYYSTEEAIQMILARASDSKLSDIELSDDDIDGRNKHKNTIVKPRLCDDAELEYNAAIDEDTTIADNNKTIEKIKIE